MERSVRAFSILVVILQVSHLVKGQITEIKEAVGMEVDLNDLKFKYYNRQHRNSSFLINITEENYSEQLKRLWNFKEDLKMITHGWISTDNSNAVAKIKDAYTLMHAYNVITLDWSYTASTKNYPVPAVMTHQVGILAAQVLDSLVEKGFTQYNRIHMIGHSLGSHVSGATSAHCKNKLGRVTGLDPAGPGFQVLLSTDMRLDETDAEFVDIIHTAAGSAGYYSPLGHADFYPNQGKPFQPGCLNLSMNVMSTVAGAWKAGVGCSHMRSYELYTESINNPQAFKSKRCDSWSNYQSGQCGSDVQYMGDHCSSQARGVYYLSTNAKPPYSIMEVMSNNIEDMENSLSDIMHE